MYFFFSNNVGSYNSQSDPTVYNPAYLPWSYIRSQFWQPCWQVCAKACRLNMICTNLVFMYLWVSISFICLFNNIIDSSYQEHTIDTRIELARLLSKIYDSFLGLKLIGKWNPLWIFYLKNYFNFYSPKRSIIYMIIVFVFVFCILYFFFH